jgi:hypothetical protein
MNTMAKRHTKKAKEDSLEETILLSKPDPFLKRTVTFILTMARIWARITFASPHQFPPRGERRRGGLLIMINKIAPKVNPALKMAILRISIEIKPKIIYVDSI